MTRMAAFASSSSPRSPGHFNHFIRWFGLRFTRAVHDTDIDMTTFGNNNVMRVYLPINRCKPSQAIPCMSRRQSRSETRQY